MALIENRPFSDIKPGDSASLVRTLRQTDIMLFALVSGDVNPAHVDADYARSAQFHEVVAHGMWIGALISTVLGTMLPGPGTIYLAQSMRFLHPVGLGDTVNVTVTVTELHAEKHRCLLDCRTINQDGKAVATGTAEVIAPTEKISRPRMQLPALDFIEEVLIRKFAST